MLHRVFHRPSQSPLFFFSSLHRPPSQRFCPLPATNGICYLIVTTSSYFPPSRCTSRWLTSSLIASIRAVDSTLILFELILRRAVAEQEWRKSLCWNWQTSARSVSWGGWAVVARPTRSRRPSSIRQPQVLFHAHPSIHLPSSSRCQSWSRSCLPSTCHPRIRVSSSQSSRHSVQFVAVHPQRTNRAIRLTAHHDHLHPHSLALRYEQGSTSLPIESSRCHRIRMAERPSSSTRRRRRQQSNQMPLSPPMSPPKDDHHPTLDDFDSEEEPPPQSPSAYSRSPSSPPTSVGGMGKSPREHIVEVHSEPDEIPTTEFHLGDMSEDEHQASRAHRTGGPLDSSRFPSFSIPDAYNSASDWGDNQSGVNSPIPPDASVSRRQSRGAKSAPGASSASYDANGEKKGPLVLLHVSIMLLPGAEEDVMRRISTTVLDRGVLIEHPRGDYQLLEEMILDGLGLDEEDEDDKADGANDDDDAWEKSLGVRKVHGKDKWDLKVYAANGLMTAGAWRRVWSDMERIDVEVARKSTRRNLKVSADKRSALFRLPEFRAVTKVRSMYEGLVALVLVYTARVRAQIDRVPWRKLFAVVGPMLLVCIIGLVGWSLQNMELSELNFWQRNREGAGWTKEVIPSLPAEVTVVESEVDMDSVNEEADGYHFSEEMADVEESKDADEEATRLEDDASVDGDTIFGGESTDGDALDQGASAQQADVDGDAVEEEAPEKAKAGKWWVSWTGVMSKLSDKSGATSEAPEPVQLPFDVEDDVVEEDEAVEQEAAEEVLGEAEDEDPDSDSSLD